MMSGSVISGFPPERQTDPLLRHQTPVVTTASATRTALSRVMNAEFGVFFPRGQRVKLVVAPLVITVVFCLLFVALLPPASDKLDLEEGREEFKIALSKIHSPRGLKGQHPHSLDDLVSSKTSSNTNKHGRSRTPSETSSDSHTDRPNASALKVHERNPLSIDEKAEEDTNGDDGGGGEGGGGREEEEEEVIHRRTVHTFFSKMKPSFQDIQLIEDGGIPVPTFLDSCKAVVSIFDKLSSTAFAPVKMDISGNIRKINEKYSTNPSAFTTLQAIVLYEKSVGQSQLSNSATQALLWLKRALHFIKEFIAELAGGEPELAKAATKAYERSLKPYHGWVVRGVFSLAVKAAPYKEEFFKHLASSRMDHENPEYQTVIMQDMDSYSSALEVVINILSDFYVSENLDSEEKV